MNENADNEAKPPLSKEGQIFLLEQMVKAIENAIRFGVLANAGGAIATLSFLATASNELSVRTAAFWPLVFFTLGIVLAGITVISVIFTTDRQLEKATGGPALTIPQPFQWIAEEIQKVEIVCVFLSFGCFIVGAAIGLILLYLA